MKFLIWLALASSALASEGGIYVGNGGGLAEKNVLFAYARLDAYLELCLQSQLCRLDPGETDLLTKIRKSLPAEKSHADAIVFKSERAAPGFFKLDGQVRVAKTGDVVGSPIFVNTDLLYTDVGDHRFKAVDLPLAASILVHELGHHQGVKDHLQLDLLGTKLQALLMRQSESSVMWNGQIVVTTEQFNVVTRDEEKHLIHQIDQVLLSYRDQIVNLTDRLVRDVHCPNPADPVLGLRIYNLHSLRGVSFDRKSGLIKKPLRAWYLLSCKAGVESDHGDIAFSVSFYKKTHDSEPEFKPELTTVQQLSCTKDASVCN